MTPELVALCTAVAVSVTSLTAMVVSIMNGRDQKRDAAAKAKALSDLASQNAEIHTLVNSRLTMALQDNAHLSASLAESLKEGLKMRADVVRMTGEVARVTALLSRGIQAEAKPS